MENNNYITLDSKEDNMENRLHNIAEVNGSRPLPPTSSAVHITEELPLRQLLEALLGTEGRRRLRLRHMTNDELFQQYDTELVLHLHNQKNLSDTRKMLARFKNSVNFKLFPLERRCGRRIWLAYVRQRWQRGLAK